MLTPEFRERVEEACLYGQRVKYSRDNNIIKNSICLSAAFIMALSMVGCNDVDKKSTQYEAKASKTENNVSSQTSSETESITEESEQSDDEAEMTSEEVMEKFGYNGTYDGEVFERIVSEITIGDSTFSLPCRISDLDDNFKPDITGIVYKDIVTFNCQTESRDDDTITYFSLCPYGWEYNEAKEKGIDPSWSAGGIKEDDSRETIIKYLGEPTNLYNGSRGFDLLTYDKGGYRLQFSIDRNNELYGIRIDLP